MTNEEYDAWKDHHRAMFAVKNTDETAATLEAWRSVFESDRFTAAELKAASDSMARNPPKWWGDHLARINESVREQRSIVAKRAAAEVQDRGECIECGSTGYVVVPMLRCVDGRGEYVPVLMCRGRVGTYYESVVYCRCALGRFIENRESGYWSRKTNDAGKGRRMLDLDEYTQHNPHWRDQLWDRRKHETETAKANRGVGAKADRLDAAIARVVEEAKRIRMTQTTAN